MAWETGTAAGYRDLLAKLKIFTSANGWKVERFVQGSANLADHEQTDELFISSPGKSGLENLVLGFKTDFSKANDRWNWKLTVSSLYSAGGTFDAMPGSSGATQNQYMYLWQHEIQYWFICDLDHLVVIAIVSGTTHACYLGKLRMYCSLGHWPRQIGCFGEGIDANGRWSSQGDGFSSFQHFRNGARRVQWIDGSYIQPDSIYPQNLGGDLISGSAPMPSGNRWMLPMTVVSNTHGTLGEFIGCHFLPGQETASGSTIKTADNKAYLVVQNIYRNGFRDYMAIGLE
ncbi:hypothetical protein ACT7T5_003459 [Vibrio cholerae]|uniref:hypothetical protein n=1 Tax=Vibrio cholerae TaxID=666 RepID=UPI000F3DE4C6|nr:hypothetical protein [Vibrio cholerae]RNE71327.1 hypothetical protein EEJ37_04040 [Vibrio cholerae]